MTFADRRVFDAETPERGVTFQEAVCIAEAQFGTIGTTGSYTPPKSAAKYKGGGVGPSPTYSYTAAVVEVEVDPETGWMSVPRVWIAHDIGRALNPTLVRGQVEGSVYMGLGEALMEEQAFRRLPPRLSHALVHKFPSMLEYKSPTCLDMPEIITDLIEHPDPAGPFGAKEVGQGPLLPIMPARGQRRLRRGGRAHRRDSGDAGEDSAGAAGEGRRQTRARRTGERSRATSRGPSPAGGAAVGRRRRTRLERAGEEVRAQGRRRRRSDGGGAVMMRLPRFRYRAPRTVAEAAIVAGRRSRRRRCCSPAAPICCRT